MNSFSEPSEPGRLTRDGRRKLAPVLAAGGREVVFAAHVSPNLVAIMRLKLADGSQERVHPALTAHQFDPAFSADGRYHCFAMSATSPQLVLVIQDTRDKAEAVFRPRDARATARHPSFAPDGSRVVFTLSDVGGQQIASVNPPGQDLRKLAESAGLSAWPSFSPDGRRIAFASSRQGDFQVYVMNADGGDVRRLTRGPGMSVRPAWSPDGRRIAFTSNRGGRYAVFVMNADGSGQRRVAESSDRDDFAAWHPDGRHLVIVRERGGKGDLYQVEVPG
jgi:TolB protein